ncbi:hemolysin XhlA family protein [Carnobacterium maltaromaticum]|nr:hemolysin XhlA family protein [Carnobacterium maltaromaticum]MDT1943370.1 hemolysin XhlA family protein [Carnobacterium maltaromaticum]MDT1998750.1 hemolysin XhlA family protein [Carnobacterium maltaromaticum]
MAISKENQKNITKLEANNKWAWGFIISIGISIVASFLTKGVF